MNTDEIVARVRAGDVEAFSPLVREHQESVWRTVSFVLADRALAEDLVQQAFVDAYRKLGGFRDGGDFGAWVRGIARNLVRQELRRRGREERRLDVYREHLEAREDGEADARELELHAALARCRDQLPEDSRTALAMRYERGLDFSEIAEEMGRTLGGARQLLQRVRGNLRRCIEQRLATA